MVEDQTFKNLKSLKKDQYECCDFYNCDFSNLNFFNFSFEECNFYSCNFSNANLNMIAIKSCLFKDSKMMGLKFQDINTFIFQAKFEKCQLDYSSFTGLKCEGFQFTDYKMHGVDFSGTNLEEAIIANCDLQEALFENTNLKKTDLTYSYNFSINPQINTIKELKVSREFIEGITDYFGIKVS